MPIDIASQSDGKVLIVHLSGTLHKQDYTAFTPVVEDAIRRNGKVRMLVEMKDFHGWSVSALWEDIKFDVKHFLHFQRLAMVGDKAWEKGMAVFCKPFTSAEIRYFPFEREVEARV